MGTSSQHSNNSSSSSTNKNKSNKNSSNSSMNNPTKNDAKMRHSNSENKSQNKQLKNWSAEKNKTRMGHHYKAKTHDNNDKSIKSGGLKDKYNHSDLKKFNDSKGFKNKAKFALNKGKDDLKGTKIAETIQKIIQRTQRIIANISANIIPIAITIAVIVTLWNLAIFGTSIVQSIGQTPHYYCELDADSNMKKSSLYKQYCSSGSSSSFELSNLNGHYLVQDGSGPCWCTSMANLLLRYYTKKGINFYDYLFDETGKYSTTVSATDSYNNYGPSTVRQFVIANLPGELGKNEFAWNTKYGSIEFAANNGKLGYTMANWGYLRDDSLDYSNVTMDDSFTEKNDNNENWVWDLSLDPSSPIAQWNEAHEGTFVIEGITATRVTVHDATWSSSDFLKNLLDEHPSGIVVWRDYGTSQHAILVTGYLDDVFYVVDPQLGTEGGFEGPVTSRNFNTPNAWTNEILSSPPNEVTYTYIEEDTPD